MLAGKGIGIFENLEDVKRPEDRDVKVIVPDMENHKKYLFYAKTYESLKWNLSTTYQALQESEKCQ